MSIGESYKNSAGWFEIKTATLNSKKNDDNCFQ